MDHHVALQRSGVAVDDLAQVLETGELQEQLEIETDGWSRSQSTDLERLRKEAEAAIEEQLRHFETRALAQGRTSITASGEKAARAQLVTLAQTARSELDVRAAEISERYSTQIKAAIRQAQEEYNAYDCEMNQIQVRRQEEQAKTAAMMRSLKLALCRWRLDYQRVYHQMSSAQAPLSPRSALDPSEISRGPPSTSFGDALDEKPTPAQIHVNLRQRFEVARRLVKSLWSKGQVPPKQMNDFLRRVAEAAARDGQAGPLLKVYHEQLKKYGAMPLLEHAHRPELLDCWLRELKVQTSDSR